MDIVNEIKKGNKRAAARLISMIENQEKEATEILKACWGYRAKSRIIGITGPPGSGKSTLTDQLVKVLLKERKRIGIIAVDPTSPITGGAFLGDRVRMSDLNGEPDIFIRSMGTRGSLGGISKAVHGAARVLEVFGMDYIFIETVGVGQSEVDVAGIADTVVLVTVPGMGDDIQAEKAGILEVADVIVVNKADHEGVDQTIQYLKSLLIRNSGFMKGGQANDESEKDRTIVQIVSTVAASGDGIPKLMGAIDDHYSQMIGSGKAEKLNRERLKSELLDLICTKFREQFKEYDELNEAADKSIETILSSDANPYSEANILLKDFIEWYPCKDSS
jgi:LAO/AO transport system ATPase